MSKDAEQLRHWLALRHVPGLGPRSWQWLLARFGTPREVLDAGDEALNAAGAGPRLQHVLCQGPDLQAVARDLSWLRGGGERHIITLQDPRYPLRLREIADPPLLLYVSGDPMLLARPQLAIVGSRNPTPGGRETAYAFARDLGACGLTITSGLALGIDGAAHRGALDGGTASIAVTGTGPDRTYPASHRTLARRLRDHGALVTELPPGTPPRARHFPRRNRLISGLSLGVLVVEATLRSGSLITARQALEQGREVFAVPGSIHNPLVRGCHDLIRQGAKLVECLDDVLAELPPETPSAPSPSVEKNSTAERTVTVQGSPSETARVLAQIDHQPVSLDVLAARTGLTAARLCSILLTLELENHITTLPGGLYLRRTQRKSR